MPNCNDDRVAVLAPCYNEGPTIGAVVRAFRQALPAATVYVFDNNSTDQTAEAAKREGAVVIREKRQGKGHVVAAMLEQVDADYYVLVDGDGTYPADRVGDLIAPLRAGEADMVVGRRESGDPEAFRRFHVAGNRLVTAIINLIFGAHLRDIMSGYRAFTRSVARNMPLLAYGFDVETEMTIQCLYRRWIIREVPVAYLARPAGSHSKLSTFHDGLRVMFRILSLFRSYKPLTFFGGLAIVLMLAAVICGAAAWGGQWQPDSSAKLAMVVGGSALAAMSLVALSIGVIVQLINFRFLELDSLLRRRIAMDQSQKEER